MRTITDRIDTFTIDGSETVVFDPIHPIYVVYGDNIKASLTGDFEGQGVYSTTSTGSAVVAHHSNRNTLYLSGSGEVTVWGGEKASEAPFKKQGKGGDSGNVIIDGELLFDGDIPTEEIYSGVDGTLFYVTSTASNATFSFAVSDGDVKTGAATALNIDWGDGTTEETTVYDTKTHTYSSAGSYVVKVNTDGGYWLHSVKEGENLSLIKFIGDGNVIGLNNSGGLRGCVSLTTAVFTNLQRLGSVTMQGCTALESVVLNEGITYSEASVFNGSGIREIWLPSTWSAMGASAFYNCPNLTAVHFRQTTPPRIGSALFEDNSNCNTIYVPTGCAESYSKIAWNSDYSTRKMNIIEEE